MSTHPDCEVFVSRVSPKMVDIIKNAPINAVKYQKQSNHYVRTTCIFCEQEKQFSPYHWITHIRSHTGEYANQCIDCNKITSATMHCNLPTEKKNKLSMFRSDVLAYRCELCNFIQLDKDRLEKHLASQHLINDLEIKQNYSEFVILPWIQRIQRIQTEENPNNALISGKYERKHHDISKSSLQ